MAARCLLASALLLVALSGSLALQQGDSVTLHAERPHEKKQQHTVKKNANHHGKKQQQRKVDLPQESLATRVAQPTGRPDKNETAAEATGVAQNAAGDLDAFIAALITNIVTIIIFFVVSSFLRKAYPLVYSKNGLLLNEHEDIKDEYKALNDKNELDPALKKVLDTTPEEKIGTLAKPDLESLFSWWSASAAVTIDEVAECRGLDIAMMLEFSHRAMKILALVGLPLVLLVGPCHCFLGGYRAGDDYLSYWGMANVVDGHPWLYWVHSIILWLVVMGVQWMLYNSMRDFMKRRKLWLTQMPTPRATTVLVEGIPEEHQSDEKLKKYFNDIFSDPKAVDNVYVVKSMPELASKVKELEKLKLDIDKKVFKVTTATGEEKTTLNTEIEDLKKEETVLQKAVADEKNKVGDQMCLSKGFVTFKSRRDAELSKMMTYTPDADEFVVCIPPDPSDVLWADLQVDPMHEKVMSVVGYALIAGVFWAYLPTVVSIAYFTSLETLAEYSASFKSMAEDPSTSALWDGLVNALALQLFIGFVPTFFVIIFSNFFCIKSGNALQHKIQEWYFYFQVIFVLLVTAIGSSLLDTLEELAEDPLSVFSLLAATLPLATHFYLNYLPLQWVTHAQNLLRLANFFKIRGQAAVFGWAVAVKKGEPEDQDYYGLGSRSARFTFMLVLTLAFCSLSPLITILGFINFWMCRKVYGYLCVFCETKKPDLGGFFYVSQLVHVSQGLFIYITLMTGVLLERDLTIYPGLIAAGTYIYQYISYNRFKTSFRWESLCFNDLMDLDNAKEPVKGVKESTGVYKQPEML